MNSQPVFYKKPVPLSKDQHGDLYINAVSDFNFTGKTNSIYIAAVEFFRASRDYAIVFGKDTEGKIFPAVILGLENDQNQYLDKKGEWTVDYIPAYIRRYPFILASSPADAGTYAVCIDESYEGLNRQKKGQPLYDDQGRKSETLERAIEFLKE
ncbi:MAG TPA: SapC family protein, partial [Gammaproteobacteria bacterium]|nr:SapC family protein [Gammaproteobacteria bacterium]